MTPEAGMGYYPAIEDDDQHTVEREDAVACLVERAQAEHHLQSAWWADAQDADAAKAAGNGVPRTPGTGWPVATSPERTTS